MSGIRMLIALILIFVGISVLTLMSLETDYIHQWPYLAIIQEWLLLQAQNTLDRIQFVTSQ